MNKILLLLLSIIGSLSLSWVPLYGHYPREGKLSIEPSIFYGFPTNNILVGITNIGTNITMTGGGGNGTAVSFYYGLDENLDLGLVLGTQSNGFTPTLINAAANFKRNFYVVSCKYSIASENNETYKLGFGLGQYSPGDLIMDLTAVGLGLQAIQYGDSIGYNFTLDWEKGIYKNISWLTGVRYSSVSYKVRSLSVSGHPFPLGWLRSEFLNLDGSSIDIILGLKF